MGGARPPIHIATIVVHHESFVAFQVLCEISFSCCVCSGRRRLRDDDSSVGKRELFFVIHHAVFSMA